MSDSSTPAAPSVSETGAAVPAAAWWSDRLNPILIRDVVQALNGRAFMAVLILALLAIAIITTVAAWVAREGGNLGREVFTATMAVLTPLITFIVPSQAFYAMRQEMRSGAFELLTLSSLTPRAIVCGRLLASAMQSLMWLSVFAPLVALTYLLRGVSIPEILTALFLAFLFSMAASALAISFGTLARGGVLGALANAVVGLALAGATIPMTVFTCSGILQQRSGLGGTEWLQLFGTIGLSVVAVVAFFTIVAESQLTHPFENRSTPFRVFLLAYLVAVCCWIPIVVARGEWWMAWAATAAVHAALVPVILLIAATEDEAFTPRQRIVVPRTTWVALLIAPLLPGRGRGLLFVLGVLALLLGAGWLLPWVVTGRVPDREAVDTLVLLVLYDLFYCGVGARIRGFMGPGAGRSWLARFLTVLVLLFGCLGPLLIELLVFRRDVWSLIHVLNPFWTIAEVPRHAQSATLVMGVVAGLALLVNLPLVWRSIGETMHAAASRRARAS